MRATQSVAPGQLAIPSKWCRVTAVATTVTGAMRWRTNAVQGMWEVQGEGVQGWPVISFLN
jgi:hypothetical protein